MDFAEATWKVITSSPAITVICLEFVEGEQIPDSWNASPLLVLHDYWIYSSWCNKASSLFFDKLYPVAVLPKGGYKGEKGL